MNEAATKPRQSRKRKVLKVLGIVLLCLLVLAGGFALALAFVQPLRVGVHDLVAQLLGTQAAEQFNQIAYSMKEAIESWFAAVGNALSSFASQVADRWVELSAWWASLHPDQAVNDALAGLFGPGAPTVEQIGSALPKPIDTGDYISNIMLIVLVVCVVAIIVLIPLIRRREDRASSLPPVATARRKHRWWVWLLAALAAVALCVAGYMTYMTAQPGWIILTLILVGFTVRTLQADV